MNRLKRIGHILAMIGLLSGCRPEEESYWGYLEDNEQFSGGEASVYDASPLAFSKPIPGLSNSDELLFAVGNSFFRQNWVAAPSSTTARDGLGPLFNARSCSGCHFQDGRGRPPEFAGELSEGLLIRLSIPGIGPHGEPVSHPVYGGQLQDQSITNVPTEGSYVINYSEASGQFADGSSYSLRVPNYQLNFTGYGDADVQFSPRVANQMIGLGLLEALSETSILERADEGDANSDGISGRPNYVWNALTQSVELGRFGWKANQPNLLQQSAGAFHGDMGITTFLFPSENCSASEFECQNAANGGTPEIADDDLGKVELYAATLAVPTRRNHDAENVLRGKELFFNIGCESCHRSKMVTGNHPKVAALSGQTIFPYTDMLLHDMGDELSDQRPDFLATGNEWRTPPLWGIGLFHTVNGHTYYLHDGRARNLEEAVLWHGGEAQTSREKYKQLTVQQRAELIDFLNSL